MCNEFDIVKLLTYSAALWHDENGTMRPLDDKQWNRIQVNWTSLSELIALEGGLVAELCAKNCVTNFQKQSIEGAGLSLQMNIKLLEIMSRKSVSEYNRFIGCLQQTQQGHVAAILLTEDAG